MPLKNGNRATKAISKSKLNFFVVRGLVWPILSSVFAVLMLIAFFDYSFENDLKSTIILFVSVMASGFFQANRQWKKMSRDDQTTPGE